MFVFLFIYGASSLENHAVAINSKLDNKEDNIELIGDVSAQTDTRNLPELKHHGNYKFQTVVLYMHYFCYFESFVEDINYGPTTED